MDFYYSVNFVYFCPCWYFVLSLWAQVRCRHLDSLVSSVSKATIVVVIVVFPGWTLWGSPSICSCTVTNEFRRVRGVCMAFTFFLLPGHEGSRSDLAPFLEGGCCYATNLSWLEVVPTVVLICSMWILMCRIASFLFCPFQTSCCVTDRRWRRRTGSW